MFRRSLCNELLGNRDGRKEPWPPGNHPIHSAFFEESTELSRRSRALKLWFSLRYHGLESFRNSIHRDLRHAQQLGGLIQETPGLELTAPTELSVVCFRYVDDRPGSELNQVNLAVLRRVNQRGRVYLSNAMVESNFCLRACVVNHRTTDSDIGKLSRKC